MTQPAEQRLVVEAKIGVPGTVANNAVKAAAQAALTDAPEVKAAAATLAQSNAGVVLKNDAGIPKTVQPDATWDHVDVDALGNVLSGVKTDGTRYIRKLDTPGLVLAGDPGIPLRAVASIPGWDHLDLDGAGNVIAGIRTDGRRFIRNLDAPGLVQSTDARLAQPATSITGWDHVEVDANNNIISGRRTDGTYYFRNLDFPGVAALAAPPAKVACWGDSMFGDHGGTGTSTASALADVLGVEVHRGGVPGQTSTEAALRQGGLDVFLTVAGNSIPASGPVAVTVVQPSGIWKVAHTWNYVGTLAGVPGTLTKAADETWTFTRATAATAATPCKPETRWVAEGAARRNWVTIFRAGKNGYYPTEILRDYKAAEAFLSGNNKDRFLALPIYNSTTETIGTNGYNTIKAINASLAEAFGSRYYDLRGWLIRNGLAEAGIVPTQADTDAIAQDCIPPSLMYDNTHLTVVGRQIEAARLAHIIKTKGWIA